VTAALGLLTVITAVRWPPSADAAMAEIAAKVNANASFAEVKPLIFEAIRRRPADYLPHLAAAQLRLREKNPEALAWLNRALYLFPKSPDLHLETARALLVFRRRSQALLEYRLALQNGAPASTTLARALPLARNVDEVFRLLPPLRDVHRRATVRLLHARRVAEALAVGRAAHKAWPHDDGVANAYVSALLSAKRTAEALEIARGLAEHRASAENYEVWARAAAQHKPGSELAVLARARKRFPRADSLAFALAYAHLRAKDVKRARALAEEILGRGKSPAAIARAHELLARIFQAEGRPHRAAYEREQARKIRATR